MTQPGVVRPLTPDEYLAWEAEQESKHEYVAGEVFDMGGASLPHGTIVLNLGSLLRNHLRGGHCRAFVADVRVRVAPEGPFFYPDVVVTCDERDRSKTLYLDHPLLVVEVLSASTAAFDRGLKFAHYRALESLQEYVLVDAERRSVECFRRGADGHWVLYPYGPGDEVELAALGFRCRIEEAYEDAEVGA